MKMESMLRQRRQAGVDLGLSGKRLCEFICKAMKESNELESMRRQYRLSSLKRQQELLTRKLEIKREEHEREMEIMCLRCALEGRQSGIAEEQLCWRYVPFNETQLYLNTVTRLEKITEEFNELSAVKVELLSTVQLEQLCAESVHEETGLDQVKDEVGRTTPLQPSLKSEVSKIEEIENCDDDVSSCSQHDSKLILSVCKSRHSNHWKAILENQETCSQMDVDINFVHFRMPFVVVLWAIMAALWQSATGLLSCFYLFGVFWFIHLTRAKLYEAPLLNQHPTFVFKGGGCWKVLSGIT